MRTACDKAMPRLPRRTHEIPYELEIDDQTWNDGNAKNPEILWYRCDWPRCPNWVKLRNTLHEQMSSAFLPRTDVGLGAPKHCSDQMLRSCFD